MPPIDNELRIVYGIGCTTLIMMITNIVLQVITGIIVLSPIHIKHPQENMVKHVVMSDIFLDTFGTIKSGWWLYKWGGIIVLIIPLNMIGSLFGTKPGWWLSHLPL